MQKKREQIYPICRLVEHLVQSNAVVIFQYVEYV